MLDLPVGWKVKRGKSALEGCYPRGVAVTAELKIGALAKRLDLNPRTIRFYEDAGILPRPARTRGGFRLYGEEDEERLRFVKAAQRLGLSLGEIKEVMAFRDRDQAPCGYVAGVIEQRLAEINDRMRELRTLKHELTELRARMRAEGVAEREGAYCHYIETAAASGGKH